MDNDKGSEMRCAGGSEHYHPIVQRALKEGHVTDLGQLSDEEARALKAAVKARVLKKGQGGGYPQPKTVYAHPEFNIESHHSGEIAKLDHAAAMDSVVRVMKKNDPAQS